MSRRAKSVEKMQVFCAWSSLRMSAWTVPRTVESVSRRTARGLLGVGLSAALPLEAFHLPIDRGIEEHRQDRGRRAR